MLLLVHLLVHSSTYSYRPQLQFENLKGVARCVVGYSGGKAANPTYLSIQDYTEALLVEFDPSVLSYEDLVLSWAQLHQPIYQRGRLQYRSAVWFLNEEQHEVVEQVVKDWRSSSRSPLYTEIEPATSFYRGEEYHQNFMSKALIVEEALGVETKPNALQVEEVLDVENKFKALRVKEVLGVENKENGL
jgi:peptide-methionine (S)-S-oxide reductase